MQLEGYAISVFAPSDADAVQALFESDPAYFEMVQHAPPGPAEAQSLVTELPPGKDYNDKQVFIVRDRGRGLAAVVDLVRDYPDAGIWFLGLIFVAPALRCAGLGSKLIGAAAAHAKDVGGRALRLAVVRENTRARALYERMGFVHFITRERVLENNETILVDVMEWAL